MKVKVTVNIDKEVYERSHQLGVNVSQACTNYLKTLNASIEAANSGNSGFLDRTSFTKEGLVRSPRFEPGSSAWQGNAEDVQKWKTFIKNKSFRGSYGSTVINLGLEYVNDLFKRDLSRVRDLPKSNRGNVLKALSNMAKCFGVYDSFPNLLKAYGIGWAGRAKNEVFAGRLGATRDGEDIWNWIKSMKEANGDYVDFMDLISISGLRLIEAVNSYNLISKLGSERQLELILSQDRKKRISGYYDSKNECLEHFWFTDLFLRNTKNAFLSFVSKPLVDKIGAKDQTLSSTALTRFGEKHLGESKLQMIRKAQGTLMINYLKKEEVDLIQGRVTGDIFMTNYFMPSVIADLKTRVFQGIREIQEKIKT